MLFTERDGIALALASSVPWLNRSTGFVGFSDGWQDLMRHRRMMWSFERAENGNVALVGEVDLEAQQGTFVLALGFGQNVAEAGLRTLASLADGFEAGQREYVASWQHWQWSLLPLDVAACIVCNGSVTQLDRWEEDPGYSPFTLAVEIATLLAAADLADVNREGPVATYLRETADAWNASIEKWIYTTANDVTRALDVEGYSVRIAPRNSARRPRRFKALWL